MSNYKLMSFQKNYTILNNKLKEKNVELFKIGVLSAYMSEVNNGFFVSRQLATKSIGTKFNYKQFESDKQRKDYLSKLKEMYKEIDFNLLTSSLNKTECEEFSN